MKLTEMIRGRKLLLLVLSVVMILCVFAGCNNEQAAPTETTAPATEPANDDYDLYWNVDRYQYDGKGEEMTTGRQIDKDSGYYIFRLANNGRAANRRVLNRKLANSMDTINLFAIELNENGVISAVKEAREVTGGYIANGYYVSKVEGNKITANTAETLKGMEVVFEITSKTKVYDVAPDSPIVGEVTTLKEMDRIVAVQNSKGEVTHVYAYQRNADAIEQLCPHCEQTVKFKAWNGNGSLPTTTGGHYYLPEDIKVTGQQSISANLDIVLDLNGKTVTGCEQLRIYSLHNEGITLSIMDSSKEQTGKMTVHGEFSHQGGAVWLRYGTFNLYSGTLDASDSTNLLNGAAVELTAGRVFNMYGGTIIGGKAKGQVGEDGTLKGGNGGAVYVNGTFNMYGGEIKGGVAESITVGDSTQGGKGGTLYVGPTGNVNLNGGKISGGTAADGYTVYVADGGTFVNISTVIEGEMRGAEPLDFTRLCPHCQTEVEFTPWTSTNTLPVQTSGHFMLVGDVSVSSQQNMRNGDNIVLDLNGKTIYVTGARGIAMFEENVYLGIMDSSEGKTGAIKGSNGEHDHEGCAVWVRYGVFDLFSGTMDGSTNTSLKNGNTVAVNAGTTFNMYDGKIIGGVTKGSLNAENNPKGGHGGALYVNGTFNMYGGSIEGGKALSITVGDTVSGGKGGSLCVGIAGTANLIGGTISGGTAERGSIVDVLEGGTINNTGTTVG